MRDLCARVARARASVCGALLTGWRRASGQWRLSALLVGAWVCFFALAALEGSGALLAAKAWVRTAWHGPGRMAGPDAALTVSMYQRPPWRGFDDRDSAPLRDVLRQLTSAGGEALDACTLDVVREVARRARIEIVNPARGHALPRPPMPSEWFRESLQQPQKPGVQRQAAAEALEDGEADSRHPRLLLRSATALLKKTPFPYAAPTRGDAQARRGEFALSDEFAGLGVVVAGLAYNIGGALSTLRERFESIARLFGRARLVIYENDSVDGTTEALRAWSAADDRVVLIAEDLGASAAIDDRVSRTQKLAFYRNKYLDEVSRPEYASFDVLVLLDTDFVNARASHEGLANAVRRVAVTGEAAGVCALGFKYDMYWDTFAHVEDLLSLQTSDFGDSPSLERFQAHRKWRNTVAQPALSSIYVEPGRRVNRRLNDVATAIRRRLDPDFDGGGDQSASPAPPLPVSADRVLTATQDAWNALARSYRAWNASGELQASALARDPAHAAQIVDAVNAAELALADLLLRRPLRQVCEGAAALLRGMRARKLHSCFGGLAVYRRDVAARCRYQADGEACEHLPFSRCVSQLAAAPLFVEPMLEVLY
jgi:hypothetical protein